MNSFTDQFWAQLQADCKELDERHIAEAIKQAMLAGDFKKYVRVDNDAQTIVYIPGMGVDELRAEVTQLKKKLQDIENILNPVYGD